jgi:GTP-binding protein YchF
MKVGIIGLPFSGKTTLFRALTGLGSGGATTDVAVVKVPDARVEALAEVYKPRKKTLAEITFVDVLAGAHAGKGFDSRTVGTMKGMEALVIVVDAREGDNEAARDAAARSALEDVLTELLLSDLAIAEKRVERIKKEKTTEADRVAVEKALANLSEETSLRSVTFSDDEARALLGYQFLTRKPVLVVVNTLEGEQGKQFPETEAAAGRMDMPVIPLCAALEGEISSLPSEERGEFLKEMGLKEAAQDRLVRAVYEHLNLISFLTVGEDEVRAWTIERGTTARKAGGKVHSDIERGFIRAEVIHNDEFAAAGSSMSAVKKSGKLRVEGKEYVVNDGEIVHFRFNV